eukprot:3353036-Karenia_brevis.AAC.1
MRFTGHHRTYTMSVYSSTMPDLFAAMLHSKADIAHSMMKLAEAYWDVIEAAWDVSQLDSP